MSDKEINIPRTVILGGLGFMVAQALVAIIWRRVIFGDLYLAERFYDVTEPTLGLFLHGLSFYFLTGALLTMLFVHMSSGRADGSANPVRYAIVTGILYWLIHDYSYIGRKEIPNQLLYLGLEAVLVIVLFIVYALVLRWLFKSS